MQTARERGADVLLFSEQYKKPGFSVWFEDASRRSGIQVCNPDITIGDFLETDKGFVWVEVAGVRIYSCYFSPNDPFKKFVAEVQALEESVRAFGGDVLIAGDFNSKSPEWGESRLDRRGTLVANMVAANDLVVMNRGRKFTFRRGVAGSIIDLTIASPRVARRIREWSVLDETTMSDHQYIEFIVSEKNLGGNNRLQGGSKKPSWNLRRLNRERLAESLAESRSIQELGWTTKPITLEEKVREARRVIIAACRNSMPRRQKRKAKKALYWWNDDLARLRRECHAARRKYTHSKGDLLLQEE
ncbi:uncharacterized protein LOC127280415 [Leptopilina boulardi]|uniref:uncharacterized protein LOC127280415 n=1 Tax=Leptopilina boulardi TaxID=63433 RepID=UPI0021F67FC7|nr:uncharacterized protein LOC127280415 [Leptopilina boulardi]